jgi:hypothetical protein
VVRLVARRLDDEQLSDRRAGGEEDELDPVLPFGREVDELRNGDGGGENRHRGQIDLRSARELIVVRGLHVFSEALAPFIGVFRRRVSRLEGHSEGPRPPLPQRALSRIPGSVP